MALQHLVFLKNLTISCKKLPLSLHGKLVITGDFNVHLDEANRPDVSCFINMISSYGLKQHVTTATHISGDILALVMMRTDDDFVKLCEVGLRHASDHNFVSCTFQQRKPPPQKAKCSLGNFKNMTPSAFKSDLENKLAVSNTLDDVNDLVDHFSTVSKAVLDLHAPQCTRTCIIWPRPRWYNEDIKQEKCKLRRLERKWRKRKLQVDRDACMIQHEEDVKLIELSKEEYFKSI